MTIGACKVVLHLPENRSLKGKRQVVKSITTRVKNKFNVSVAEVDGYDLWQTATLGIAYVSNSGPHANEVLSKVVDFINGLRVEANVMDYEIDIVHTL